MMRRRLDRMDQRLQRIEPDPDYKPWELMPGMNPTEAAIEAFQAEHPDCRLVIVNGDYPPIQRLTPAPADRRLLEAPVDGRTPAD